MNVYDAKHITIPNGKVKRILDSSNNVLWEETIDNTVPFFVEDVRGVVNGEANRLFIKHRLTKNSYTQEVYPDDAPAIEIEYSFDRINWYVLGTTSTTSLTIDFPTPYSRIYLRANATTWSGVNARNAIFTRAQNRMACNLGGNIMSLLYGSNFTGDETTFPVGSKNTFKSVFGSYSGYEADSALHIYNSIEHLILPATILVENCYYRMFRTALTITTAPEIRATTLAEWCCYEMFYGCTSLTTAPVLPATTLAPNCYTQMFSGCSALNEIKCNASDISAAGCVSAWVRDVAASGTFYKNTSMSSWPTGDSGIPSGWTVQDL